MHAIDLPGHGRSAGVVAASFDDAVDAVARVLPDAAVTCGWSLGGLFAQRLARRHPGHVRKLALVATTPCFTQRVDWRPAMKPSTLEQFTTALAVDRDTMLKRFVALNAMHSGHGGEAVRAFTKRLLARDAPSDAGLAAALGWMREVDLRQDAARLEQPAVVLHGARDMLAPVGAGRWLAATLRDARLVELADAAHMPFFSHPAAFVAAVDALLG